MESDQWTDASGAVDSGMIDGLYPDGKFMIEIVHVLSLISFDSQAALKTLLDCLNDSFDLSFAPGMVRFCVE